VMRIEFATSARRTLPFPPVPGEEKEGAAASPGYV
jgi:hypothetical protein